MKKYQIVIIIVCIGLCIGCQKQKIDEKSIIVNDVKISLHQDFHKVAKEIGNFKLHEQMKSCLYPGYNHEYTYPDMVLTTYPKNGKDCIQAIRVFSNNVKQKANIKIGDSSFKVKSYYHEEPVIENSHVITYEHKHIGISYYLKQGRVDEYELYALVD